MSMNAITLEKSVYAPFEAVTGEVRWQLDRAPKNLELRLFWSTRGRGTQEAHVTGSLPLAIAGEREGAQSFRFELPGEPWSMDGQLISVIWGLELVEKKGGSLALEEIVVSPTGVPVALTAVAESLIDKRGLFKKLAARKRAKVASHASG